MGDCTGECGYCAEKIWQDLHEYGTLTVEKILGEKGLIQTEFWIRVS